MKMRIIDPIQRLKPVQVLKVEPEKWEVDISVKVQIDIVGSIIQEWIDREQIREIVESQERFEDPSVW